MATTASPAGFNAVTCDPRAQSLHIRHEGVYVAVQTCEYGVLDVMHSCLCGSSLHVWVFTSGECVAVVSGPQAEGGETCTTAKGACPVDNLPQTAKATEVRTTKFNSELSDAGIIFK